MPTYAYRCESCGHEFDEFQSIKAEPIKVCPKCKRHKVRRLIGIGAAVLFKGSGFYETDYRSKTYADDAKADGPSSSSTTSSTTSTSTTESGKASASTGEASKGKSGGNNGTKGSNGSNGKSGGTNGSAGSNGAGK